MVAPAGPGASAPKPSAQSMNPGPRPIGPGTSPPLAPQLAPAQGQTQPEKPKSSDSPGPSTGNLAAPDKPLSYLSALTKKSTGPAANPSSAPQLGLGQGGTMASSTTGSSEVVDEKSRGAASPSSSHAQGVAGATKCAKGPSLTLASDSLLKEATKARNQLQAILQKQRHENPEVVTPAAITAGYNTETGQVAAKPSGDGGCAEDNVVAALGGDRTKVRFTKAMRPRTGQEQPVCKKCQSKYKKDQFPRDTTFD